MMAWRLDIDESFIYCGDRLVARLETGGSNDDWREATRLGAEMVQSMAVYEALMRDGRKRRKEGEFAEAESSSPPLRVPACPFAVFDEFSEGADDRVQDYAARLVAGAEREERARCAATVERLQDLLHRMLEAPTTSIRESWKDAIRQALALGPNA